MGAHLGHTGQLGSGAARDVAASQFQEALLEARLCVPVPIPGLLQPRSFLEKFRPIFSERHAVTWAPGCLQHCHLL